MKKILLLVLFILSITSCSSTSKEESLKKLGEQTFDSKVWLNANEAKRGAMIYDFIKKNTPITDKNREFIISQLGKSTGYYEYDHNLAYYIGSKPPNSNIKAYLIAFIIDHENNKVKDIYIHPEIK